MIKTLPKRVKDGICQDDRLIYLLEEDKDRAAQRLLQLTNARYTVRHFKNLADFSTALASKEAPLAIVLNTAFHEADNAGIDLISKLQRQPKALAPVIFISRDTGIAKRLAAVRAGGQYFLNESLAQHTLITTLEQLAADAVEDQPAKILLIDDVAAQSLSVEKTLNDPRFELQILSEPLNLLNSLNHFSPDVILISCNLSSCSGLELGQVIRQHDISAQTPILFLLSTANEHLHVNAINSDSDDFINLSIQPSQLLETLLAKIKRTRSKRQLEQSQQHSLDRSEFYHFAMDQHNIVSITDINGRITEVNDKFCAISGYQRDELIGQNHSLIKSNHHNTDLYREMWDTIRSGQVWHGEICNLAKDGREYWVDSTIVPFIDRRGKPWQYISVRTDISALRNSEDHLQHAQDFANIGSWDWNIDSDTLYWSESIGPLFGYPHGTKQLTFDNFRAAIHPDDLSPTLLAIENCIEHGQKYDVEHRVIWPDGSIHWAHGSGDVIRNAEGNAIRMIGVVQDITRRKENELGLQEEQRRLKQAQQMGAIGDWWINFDDNKPHYSDEAARILGQQSFVGQLSLISALEKIDARDRIAIAQDSKNVVRLGQSKIEFCMRLDKKNTRWVQIARRVIRGQNGKVVGFRGTVQDITERKEAEQHQQHHRLILEKIATDAPLLDTLTLLIQQTEMAHPDRFGAILTVDPATGRILCGAAPSLPDTLSTALAAIKIDARLEVYSKHIISDISQGKAWQRFRDITSEAGFYICCSRTLQASSDQLLGILLIFSASPGPVICDCMSPTRELVRFTTIALEQKQALWSLVEAKEDADKANQAKSQFLSRIGHDLRTPLSAIMGFGQLLSMDTSSPLSERQCASLLEINKASEHLLDLISDILNLSQVESGQIELHVEAIDACAMIAECEALISPLAKERDIVFSSPCRTAEAPPGPPSYIKADRKRLKQVLLNLLGNAVKYNRQGGTISVSCKPAGQYVRILVTDTGKGLNTGQQAKLFSAFDRLGAEHSSIKGSGIGLVIAKGLVENMGGAIGVNSEPGKGSTFWIDLPKIG